MSRPPILSVALPSDMGRVLSIQSHTVQISGVWDAHSLKWLLVNHHGASSIRREPELRSAASDLLKHPFVTGELDDLQPLNGTAHKLIALILGHIWHSGNSQMRTRIELLLRQNKLTKEDVKDILQEYHDNIGDLDGPEEKERAQARTKEIISAL